jgi:monoamine oxidase
MDTTSAWTATSALPRFPPLRENRRGDVVVVGAGLTGITAACLLKRAGLVVAPVS